MGTPASRALVTDDASIRALGYPMARMTVEGYDVVEVHRTATEAIERARQESQPMLLEYKTYRYRGHSMADPGKYRTKEEVEAYRQRDPLILAEARLEREFPALHGKIGEIKREVEEEIQDAVRFAHESPEPDQGTVGDYTYI
jgi:pyruvate dehydrogenase E1 component alpha subunit